MPSKILPTPTTNASCQGASRQRLQTPANNHQTTQHWLWPPCKTIHIFNNTIRYGTWQPSFCSGTTPSPNCQQEHMSKIYTDPPTTQLQLHHTTSTWKPNSSGWRVMQAMYTGMFIPWPYHPSSQIIKWCLVLFVNNKQPLHALKVHLHQGSTLCPSCQCEQENEWHFLECTHLAWAELFRTLKSTLTQMTQTLKLHLCILMTVWLGLVSIHHNDTEYPNAYHAWHPPTTMSTLTTSDMPGMGPAVPRVHFGWMGKGDQHDPQHPGTIGNTSNDQYYPSHLDIHPRYLETLQPTPTSFSKPA